MDVLHATTIENRTFDEIAVGDSASMVRTLTLDDIELFAIVSGDLNPSHVDPAYAAADEFHGVVAHGAWFETGSHAQLGWRGRDG